MKNKKLDITTHWQKGFAVLLLFLLVFIIWKFLTLIVTGVVVGLIILFHRVIWDGLNILVWHSTKWMIKNNVVYYLEKSYSHLKKEFEDFSQATDAIAIDMGVVKKDIEEQENKKANAIMLHANTSDPLLKEEFEAETYAIKEQLDFLKPTLAQVEQQYEIMVQIREMREQDLNLFKIKLDAQIKKYNILKNLNKASTTASKFIGDGDSKQAQEYKRSSREMERAVQGYMVNIENTNKKMIPELKKFSLNKKLNKEKSLKIIDAYKKTRLDL